MWDRLPACQEIQESGHLSPASSLQIAWLLVVAIASPAAADIPLPDESRLPGDAAVATQLPSESQLPAGMAIVSPRLPSESELPQSLQIAAAPDPEPDEPTPEVRPQPKPGENRPTDDERIAKAIDDVPWLQLALPGPTARVQAITFSPDSQRLCAAGDDKTVIVYSRVAEQEPSATGANNRPARDWIYERTLRWQVRRGSRGAVMALAASGNRLALAGYSAMGSLNDIWLNDLTNGDLLGTLVEDVRRDVVISLAFDPDPGQDTLVSADRGGHIQIWEQHPAGWQPRTLVPPDRQTYGEQEAEQLVPFRGILPLAVTDKHVIAPSLAGWNENKVPQWHIVRIDRQTGQKSPLPDEPSLQTHGRVMDIATSADRQRIASIDGDGRVRVWQLGGNSPPLFTKIPAAIPLALAMHPDGSRIVVATSDTKKHSLVTFQIGRNGLTEVKTQDVSQPVFNCTISPDARWLAYEQQSTLVVESLAQPARAQRIRSGLTPPLRAMFPRKKGDYRIAFGTRAADDGSVTPTAIFDTQSDQLRTLERFEPNQWMGADSGRGPWRIVSEVKDGDTHWWLDRDGQRRGKIPLRADIDLSTMTAQCWIPNAQGAPAAVAVGARGNHHIYICGLIDEGTCPILRQFRGHASEITSLGMSADLRYLISSSLDGTIRIWPMHDVLTWSRGMNAVGARLRVENDQLLVAEIAADGPLYNHGVRAGDVITQVSVPEELEANSEEARAMRPIEGGAPALLKGLYEQPWHSLIEIHPRRGVLDLKPFLNAASWPPLATLVVADNREWAYFTPAGFYDASFEGHKLFGWLINRGPQQRPDFFSAAQLRQVLERPEMMSRLLRAGNLEAAFKAAQVEPPANAHDSVSAAHRLQPRVEIVAPQDGQEVRDNHVYVRAEILIQPGQQLIPPKAFANGVVAIDRQRVSDETVTVDGKSINRQVYTWRAVLPHDRRLKIEVVAATDSESSHADSVTIRRNITGVRPRGNLYLVTAGINRYHDSQIPTLDFAVNNARRLSDIWTRQANDLYRSRAVSLVGDQVTRPHWHFTAEQFSHEILDHITPDDLLVIFLSGHGVRDPDMGDYYYLTASTRLADIRSGRYAECISFSELGLFADIPCRKLVILDTCHSGAVQPLEQRELKGAIRLLQEDLIFTLTASEGTQEAAETREHGLGRFTYRLLEALRGAADAQRDGVVTLRETANYVRHAVASDSAREQVRQYPTAGPQELLDLVELPLTTAAKN